MRFWNLFRATAPCHTCAHPYAIHNQNGVKTRCSMHGCTCLSFVRNWGILQFLVRGPISATDICKCSHQLGGHTPSHDGKVCNDCEPVDCWRYRKDGRATRADRAARAKNAVAIDVNRSSVLLSDRRPPRS